MRHDSLAALLVLVLSSRAVAQEPPQAEPVREAQEPQAEKQDPVQGGDPPPASEQEGAEKPEPQQEKAKEAEPAQEPQGPPPEVQGPSPVPATPPAKDPVPATPAKDPAPAATAAGTSVPGAEASPAGGAPAAPSHPAVVWPLAIDALEMHLRGIAETHPEVASLEVLGRSAGGREILALRLGVESAEASAERPVLLLVDYQGPASAGPEALVALGWRLALEAEHDERTRSLLGRASLVLAPALDPDARASSEAAPGAVRFERNFPSGWQPDSVRPGSGRISLSKPEALAAARYLAGLKGCAMILGFAAPAPRGVPYPGAELPAADRAVFARLCAALELEGASSLVPWLELGSPGGGLFDFAYQARGIYPLLFPLPAEDALAAGGQEAYSAGVATRVLRCLTLLPRVELTQEGLERVTNDTWQLDVRIQNVGIVPTSSAIALRGRLADVTLQLEGAKLVATAKKPTSEGAFTEASLSRRAPLSGGTLEGGEGRWLRLLLEAGSGAEVQVTASSLWAGSESLRVTLP